MDLLTTTRTVSESYDDGLAAYHSGAFQFNAVIAVLNIHMEHLFEDAFTIAGFRCFSSTASGKDDADQQQCKNSFHIATSFLFGSFILIWKNPG